MKARGASPGPRYQALLQLLRTADALWCASAVFFARWGLGPSQFNVLNLLCDVDEGLTQTGIGQQLVMHRSNVTGLVDRLEKRGLVERRERPGDRRAYRVVLTGAGRKLVREILPHFYAAAEAAWGKLPVDRVEGLVSELAEVRIRAERTVAEIGSGAV